jgi:hypothetical protein
MKDDYQEAMEWIDDIVNSIYNARGAIYEKPEEDYYKEHGKYVEYYFVGGDAGFCGTDVKDYYRVRSDRKLDEKEVEIAVNKYFISQSEDMWSEMYETACDILESQEEIDYDDENCEEYIEGYVGAYYDKVRGDYDLLQELKESGVCYSEKVNDYLTIQKLNY